ncbi:ATP-binding cassette domain-containing protein [Martelella sp. HB161492]|uniref:thiamine ABC transporter ATP-binding protein n=1 Tax=Martelella sp. HB161492 TaxID=2720726 RepID=UPI00159247EB|nr:ATP-binding cassette domain-containing protein [Martelella sp. HB161492]
MAAHVTLDRVELFLGSAQFHFDGTIDAGTITAVTGRSGAGKSTLINLIAGFAMPDAGKVMIGGQDMTGLHVSRRPLTLVFQDNNLFSHLDIFTNVALGISATMRLFPEDRQRIDNALVRVGLDGFGKRMPATLSGGERQRVAFARALVRERPILLLDEPFAALDPEMRAEMVKLLLELHQETGNTVIMVSHEPDEMNAIAESRIIVENGRFLAGVEKSSTHFSKES